MARPISRIFLVVTGVVVLVLAPAFAASADDLRASYAGDVLAIHAGGEQEKSSTTVTLDCAGDVCQVATALFDVGVTVDFTKGGVSNEVIYPATGDPCVPDSYDPGWAMSVSYSATGTNSAGVEYHNLLDIHYGSAAGGSYPCPIPNGLQWYTYSQTGYTIWASLDDPCPSFATCPVAEQAAVDTGDHTPVLPGEPFHTIGGAPVGSVSAVGADPADPAAPSVLAAVPTIQSAATSPTQIFAALFFGAVAAGIAAFVAFASPAAAQFSSELIGKLPWTKGVGKRLRAIRNGVAAATARVLSGPPLVAWAVVAATYLVAIILSVLIDPGAGLNAGTGRMALSLLVVFAIQSVVGWLVLRAVLGRKGEPVVFRPTLSPGVIVLIIAAVLFSRVLGFEPGIVFGALLGLTFGASLSGARHARAAILGSGVLVGLSLVGWVAYSIAIGLGLDHAGFAGVFILETLGALVVAGASGLAVALLPLKAFEGRTIWDWNKAIWAVVYAGGAFYALIVLGLLPFDPSTISAPFLGWLLLYVAIGVVALVLWLLARRAARVTTRVAAATQD